MPKVIKHYPDAKLSHMMITLLTVIKTTFWYNLSGVIIFSLHQLLSRSRWCLIYQHTEAETKWRSLCHYITKLLPLFVTRSVSYYIVLFTSPVFVTGADFILPCVTHFNCLRDKSYFILYIFIHLTALHDKSWFHDVYCYSPHRTSWQALLSCRIVLLTSPLFVTRADFTHSPQWIMATFFSRSPNATKMTFDIIYIYIYLHWHTCIHNSFNSIAYCTIPYPLYHNVHKS